MNQSRLDYFFVLRPQAWYFIALHTRYSVGWSNITLLPVDISSSAPMIIRLWFILILHRDYTFALYPRDQQRYFQRMHSEPTFEDQYLVLSSQLPAQSRWYYYIVSVFRGHWSYLLGKTLLSESAEGELWLSIILRGPLQFQIIPLVAVNLWGQSPSV